MTGPAQAFTWRAMRAEDLDDVVRVARCAFPNHLEAAACFEERLRLFPDGCFALTAGARVDGYLIAYPWPLESVPPLDSLLGRLPENSGAWYLHDLALHPAVRGQGHARPIVERLVARARTLGAKVIALVSVNETRAFWRRLGFVEVPWAVELAHKLESYGAGAAYMTREL